MHKNRNWKEHTNYNYNAKESVMRRTIQRTFGNMFKPLETNLVTRYFFWQITMRVIYKYPDNKYSGNII